MRFIITIFLLFSLSGANDELYNQGEKLYFSKGCNGCHGVNANGLNEYPSLANRAKGFLANKLKIYRDGKISSQQALLMTPYAQSLSENEIDAITTFLHKYVDKSTEKYHNSFQTQGDGGS